MTKIIIMKKILNKMMIQFKLNNLMMINNQTKNNNKISLILTVIINELLLNYYNYSILYLYKFFNSFIYNI